MRIADTAPIRDPDAARAFLDRLEREARRLETPCGAGAMVWRLWGGGPALVLLHGGAGSWRHWARNIRAAAQSHTVIAPDLPGLGDSAPAPHPVGAEAIASILARGLDIVLGGEEPYDLAGFSFGAVIAGLLAGNASSRVRSLTLIGAGGLGPPSRSVPLERVRDKSGAERTLAHRTNLARLMLFDPAAIDALAVAIQEENSKRARLVSGAMWISPVLREVLPRLRTPVYGVWGEHEMADRPLLDLRVALLREARPDVRIEIVERAGHWVFFEAAETFNAILSRILAG